MTDMLQAIWDRQAAYQDELRAKMIMKDRVWSRMRRAVRERLELPQFPEDLVNDDD